MIHSGWYDLWLDGFDGKGFNIFGHRYFNRYESKFGVVYAVLARS